MLTFTITKEWLDLIRARIKLEEYREIKPYYDERLLRFLGEEIKIKFRNGYSTNSPSLICNCKVTVGEGKPEWGALPNQKYYVLKILNVEESTTRH